MIAARPATSLLGLLLRLADREETALQAGPATLAPPTRADFPAWLDATRSSEASLRRWQPAWSDDYLTEAAYRRRLALFDAERAGGQGFAFHLWREGRLDGAIRLSPVHGGARSAGRLGYWVADRAAGQGLATEAVHAVCGFAFERLRLARVEAAFVPENAASARVLAKAGFVREGLARSYVEVCGVRRDHVLTARLNPDLDPASQRDPKATGEAPSPPDAL